MIDRLELHVLQEDLTVNDVLYLKLYKELLLDYSNSMLELEDLLGLELESFREVVSPSSGWSWLGYVLRVRFLLSSDLVVEILRSVVGLDYDNVFISLISCEFQRKCLCLQSWDMFHYFIH